MAQRGPYRVYTDDDRARGIAALEAAGGRSRLAEAVTGIPDSTLEQWRDSPRRQRTLSIQPELRAKAEKELEERFQKVAERMTEHVLDMDLSKTGAKDAMIAAGIAQTHLRLLRSQPTSITAAADLTSFLRGAGYVEVIQVTPAGELASGEPPTLPPPGDTDPEGGVGK